MGRAIFWKTSVLALGFATCAPILLNAEPGRRLAHPAATEPGNVAFAFPRDVRFLFDQIDLELTLPNIDKPIKVATRPSQHIFISLPVPGKGSLVRKFSLQMVPQVNHKDAASYDELANAPDSDITFKAVFNCIEENRDPSDSAAKSAFQRRTPSDVCIPRSLLNQRYETVRDIGTKSDIEIGGSYDYRQTASAAEPHEALVAGVRVIGYHRQFPGFREGEDPFGKPCKEINSIQLCSSKVD